MKNGIKRFGCFNTLTQPSAEICVVAPTVEVIEGADLYDVVAPVSKFTGHRENPLSLLAKLTGAKADVLNVVLQELPTVASDPRLSDEDRVAYIVERCSTGTPAEDALMAERLMNDIDALCLRNLDVDKPSDSSIQFDSKDSPNPDAQ